MALKRPRWKPGTVVTLEHASSVLKYNPLGDPHVRRLALWLPPQYDAGAGRGRGRRFPVLFDLVGFTGSGLAHVAWKNFSDNVPERAARLVHEGRMGPAILVFPDCFTALGGNQYVNSSAIGRYADYLTRELVPFVDREFLAAVWKKPKLSMAEGHCIMNLCMAATYDPDPAAPNGFRLPFNLETGEVLPERWRQWQRHDPVRLVERYKRNLKSLRGIYIDCGWRDQFHIHYGSRILSRRLHEAGIAHTYQEFDDDHSDIDYRMDVSLTFLYRALKA